MLRGLTNDPSSMGPALPTPSANGAFSVVAEDTVKKRGHLREHHLRVVAVRCAGLGQVGQPAGH